MMMTNVRIAAKELFAPLLYRFPPIGLEPPQLGVYLKELLLRREVPGDVAEIGCSVGGTACLASKIVRKYSPGKKYICYDTFGGFVEQQSAKDMLLGTPKMDLTRYRSNSDRLVKKILSIHGCADVVLVKCDIATVAEDLLRDNYSVVLLDVDLSEPTYYGLKKMFPRLSEGGIILVDDCSDEVEQVWRARQGFEQFCQEAGLVARVEFGLGIVTK